MEYGQRQMNIVFYRHSLLNRGGDKMVVVYANYLAENGFYVTIFANTIDTVFKISEKVRIQKIKTPGYYGTLARALLLPIKADMIIADVITMTTVLSVRHFKRVVYFAQDYDVSYYYDNPLMKYIMHVLYKITLGILKVPTIAVSQNLKNELLKYSKNIHVVNNGIDSRIFYPDTDLDLVALKNNRKAIVCFKRSDFRKGFDILEKALSRLDKDLDGQSFELWVIGEELKKDAYRFPIRNFGYVSEEKLRKVLSSADVFVYPTRHEGFGLLVLEALACRCPVVTTKAVPIVEHLNQAWASDINDFVEFKNGILTVLGNKQLQDELTANGLVLAKQYSLDKSYQQLAETINSIHENV